LKKTIALLVLLVLPSMAMAADSGMGRSNWSLEVKGGFFTPALDDWSHYYDRKSMPQLEASLAYLFAPQLEAGVGSGWMRGKGHLYAPQHASFAGNVIYDLYPVNVFVLVRGVMSDEQWLIPYIGGGWTRMYYQEKVEGENAISGHADGYHIRGGLQLSLDVFDPKAANTMLLDYGIEHTFIFIEAEYTRAVVNSVSIDLGGTSYLGGLRIEF
jgi:hypothetical protein